VVAIVFYGSYATLQPSQPVAWLHGCKVVMVV
jgi:hypothetical protein